MKKKIITAFIPLLFCLQTAVHADNKCVAFTNYSSEEVGFYPDAGGYIVVPPRGTKVFWGDELSYPWGNTYYFGAISPSGYTSMEVPPGSVIIYGGVNLYYVDKNPEVSPCK